MPHPVGRFLGLASLLGKHPQSSWGGVQHPWQSCSGHCHLFNLVLLLSCNNIACSTLGVSKSVKYSQKFRCLLKLTCSALPTRKYLHVYPCFYTLRLKQCLLDEGYVFLELQSCNKSQRLNLRCSRSPELIAAC